MRKNGTRNSDIYTLISRIVIILCCILITIKHSEINANILLNNDINNQMLGKSNYIESKTSIQYEFENRYKHKIIPSSESNDRIDGNISFKEGILKPLVKIDANLTTDIYNNVKVNDEITVNYEIDPQDIDFSNSDNNTESKQIEEAIFVVDVSQKMNSGRRDSLLVNAFTNQILDKDINYIKFGVVGYNNSAYVGDVESHEPKKSLMKEVTSIDSLKEPLVSTYGNAKDAFRLLFQGGDNTLKSLISNNDTRNIETALGLADDILTQKGDSSKGKAIVIISSGKFSEYNNETIKRIRAKGYRIITLDVSNNTEEQNLIEKLHEQLGGVTGEESDHIKAVFEANSGNILNVDNTMKDVADKLRGNTIAVNNEKKVNATLNFDVGDYLEYVGGSNSENVSISNNESKMTINLPEINYTDNDGDGIYEAAKFNISFKLKVTGKGNGTITFNSPEDKEVNNIYYLDFYNRENKNLVDIPTINVADEFTINANLIGITPNYPYLDDEVTITYEVDPKEFIKENTGDISVGNAGLVFKLGEDFNLVDNQSGIELNDSGEVILNLADKIKYKYDSTNNKYTAEKFTVSFKVKATKVEKDLTFEKSQIKYGDIFSSNNSIIEKDIEKPIITVRPTETIPSYDGPDIRILEVEPADSFKLTKDSSGKTTTGVEPKDNSEGGRQYIIERVDNKEYKVEIVHMTMPEFIGKVDDLNGKYDVVVIGRFVDNDLKLPNETNDISKEGTYWFRDYNLLENDITNRKANEIREFIKSGQLVYLDSGISDKFGQVSGVNYEKDDNSKIAFSKLSNLFNDTKLDSYSKNLIKTSSVNSNENEQKITISNIVKKYHERVVENGSLIKPVIVSSSPESDNYDDELGEVYRRNMRFKVVQKNISSDEQVNINLYLDINGDGLFKSEELVKSVENVVFNNEEFTFNYDFYADNPEFIGYLDWRIEVVKPVLSSYETAIKSYYDGNVLFRRISGEARTVKVLQISPFDNGYLNDKENSTSEGSAGNNKPTNIVGNLNLETNKKFNEILKLPELKDYNIDIDVISYQDFYQGNFDLSNSNYEMVIMGFADTYSDVGSKFEDKAINQIKEYLNKGLGIMLTHDTIYYKKNSGVEEDITKSNKLVKSLRDIVGQSRYIDPNNGGELGLNDKSIVHDYDKPSGNAGASIGSTLWRRYDNESNTKEVYKVNESLLTNYPFELGNTIEVRRTHAQWLQLNLEDEDVVPAFTLTENNGDVTGVTNSNYKKNYVNKYDTRNSYYTYSKGNITFSGTGETRRDDKEYPESELKLFVNTIIKAERGANHRPTITALEGITEIPYNSNLNFNVVVKDIDGDNVKVNKILLDGKDISSKVYSDEKDKIPSELKEQGSQFPISIPKDLFVKNKEMTIAIEAQDAKGATSIKEYVVIPVQNPLLTSDGKIINSLVNENISFEIPLYRKNDTEESGISIGEIKLPSVNGEVNLKDVKVEKRDGEFYLVGHLAPLVEKVGMEIPIVVNYKNGTSSDKSVKVNIIVNSRLAKVNVLLKDSNNNNTRLTPKIVLNKDDNSNKYEGVISEKTGITEFTTIASGKYKISVEDLIGYSVSQILINKETAPLGNAKFDIDFSNPIINVEIIVSSNVSDLTHGLYEGINEDDNISILQNEDGFKLVAGSNVNFGSTFTLGGNSSKIKLSIDSKLEQSSNNNIKVYKVEKTDGKTKLTKFNEDALEIKYNNSSYEISIKESIPNNTEILILYTAKIPKGSINKEYNNIITINDMSKKVRVYTIQGDTDKDVYLPDLF